jgi:surfeit locus 1 family protein
MTLVMLVVLVSLGTWQVHRLAWKEAILARIAEAEAAPPIPLPAHPSPYTKVSVSGTFVPNLSALYGAFVRDTPAGPTIGARLIEPLRRDDGAILLVDRGWVPLKRAGPIHQFTGHVTVTGYVRAGDQPGWFSATDDPAARRFYTLDPKAIGAAFDEARVAPYVLVTLAAKPGPEPELVRYWPEPAHHLPRPPNNHLAYIITWYGLAIALMVVFIVWARQRPAV